MVSSPLPEGADFHKFSILNEPNMILLGAAPVDQWSKEAYSVVRDSGFNRSIIISDGFLPPTDFTGVFPQTTYPGYILRRHQIDIRLIIDMHNYVS